jgi:flagellar biosynthesis/type III secretory pathway protein FliH
MLATTSCGLHLHNPNDAKQAQRATEEFNKLKLDATVAIARDNVATLTREEIDTRRNTGMMLVRRDGLSVVSLQPVKPNPGVLPRGWPKLLMETEDALRRYQLVPVKNHIDEIRLMTQRFDNAENLALEQQVYGSLVQTYKRPGNPGTQSTDCKELLAKQPLSLASPPGEDPERWTHYREQMAPACERIKTAERAVNKLEAVLKRDPGYAALVEEIEKLEGELMASKKAEQETARAYEKAKAELAEATQRLANATGENASDLEKKQVNQIKKTLKDATTLLAQAVDESKKVPLFAAVVKADLLNEIIGNTKFLSGESTAPADEVVKKLASALTRYPDIAARLKAAANPTANVYMLELALQQLRYHQLVEDQSMKKDIVALLRAKQAVMAEGATAWGRVAETLSRPPEDFPAELHTKLESMTVSKVLSTPEEKGIASIHQAVIHYLTAKILEDSELPIFEIKLADRYYHSSINYSEIALHARNDLIRAPLQEIATYHDGGIRREDIAALLQALGVAGVAVGVNR